MGRHVNNTLEGSELTVAQLAIAQPGALAVFTKYNIDYCCGGHLITPDQIISTSEYSTGKDHSLLDLLASLKSL